MKFKTFDKVEIGKEYDYRCVETDSVHLNEVLGGGLRTDNLIVIQGPSGVGKTTFLQRLALNCIDAGETVLYISAGEQDIDELSGRFGCMVNAIEYEQFVSNRTEKDVEMIKATQTSIGEKLQLVYTEDPNKLVSTEPKTELIKCLDYAVEKGIKYVVFDYLGSVISDTADSQYALLTKIAGELKNIATENHMCIITAMQTNRALKEYLKGKKIDYTMLDEYFMGDSVGPAKKASICMTICRDMEDYGKLHINVFKNRLNGSLEDVSVMIQRKTFKWYDTI